MTETRINELEALANRYNGVPGAGGLVRATQELAKALRSTQHELAKRDCEVNSLKECMDSIANSVSMVGFTR